MTKPAPSPFPLAAAEAEPVALWFRQTLDKAASMRARQDVAGADWLVRRCREVWALMSEHGAMHGHAVELLFADIREALEAA